MMQPRSWRRRATKQRRLLRTRPPHARHCRLWMLHETNWQLSLMLLGMKPWLLQRIVPPPAPLQMTPRGVQLLVARLHHLHARYTSALCYIHGPVKPTQTYPNLPPFYMCATHAGVLPLQRAV